MSKRQAVVSILLIVVIVSLAFLPSLDNGFVNDDDPLYVYQNPLVRELSWGNIKATFTAYHCLNYHPLALLSHAIEFRFFGDYPRGYHFSNLILHLLNALLVFWLIFILSKDWLVSFLTSVFFGIHPLHVESVAWISERRDVLFTFFFLLSVISYLFYLKGKSREYYYYSIILFIFSALSKAMAITLPLVLLLVDYLYPGKAKRAGIKDKIPFFAVAFIFGLITFFARYSGGDFKPHAALNIYYNLSVVSFSVLFYLAKMIVPLKLSCVYPYAYGSPELASPVFLFSFLAAVGLIGIAGCFVKNKNRLLFGLGFFIVTMLPALNIIPSTTARSVVSDRYFYLSSIGLFYLAGEFLRWTYEKVKHIARKRFIFWVGLITLIYGLAFLTSERCRVWHDSITLWNDAIEKYPDIASPVVYYNRGISYAYQGEDLKALPDMNKALTIFYAKLGVKEDYGDAYMQLSRQQGYPAVYNLLAVKFAQINRTEEAVILLKMLLMRDPSDTQALSNLCSVYGNSGRYKEAIESGKKLIELAPNSAQAHYNLSLVYFLDGQYNLSCRYGGLAVKLGFIPQEGFPDFFGRCGIRIND